MIDGNTYNAGITGYPPVLSQKPQGAGDAADAADFARILGETHRPSSLPAANSALPEEHRSHSFLSFLKDVIDVINPLQHIPVIGAIYRHITGDEMSPMAHLAGDTLYGGPIGGAFAVADIAYQKTTGKDIGETVIASLTGSKKPPETPPASDTMIARQMNDKISPAAGARKGTEDITWFDNTDIANAARGNAVATKTPLFLPPTPRTGTIGQGPAFPSTYAPPAPQTKSTVSTTALQVQEAPAGAARKAAPPESIALPVEKVAVEKLNDFAAPVPKEMIAQKMMEALDKYAAMKRGSLAPTLSVSH